MNPLSSAISRYIRRPLNNRARSRRGQRKVAQRTGKLWLDRLEERYVLSYPLVDLGTLGGPTSYVYAMNAAGQVIGQTEIAGNPADHGFLWDGSHGMQDLGNLGDGSGTFPYAINDNGQVVGRSYVNSGKVDAFVWDSTHGMKDLGSLPGGSGSLALAINDAGQVVGNAEISPIHDHAFVWDSTHGMQDIGTLGGTDSTASFINNAGFVAGDALTASGADDTFVWDSTHGMQDIGTLGGAGSSTITGINDSGQVVGRSPTASGASHAFVWDSSHGMQDLGTLGGSNSAADLISNAGQVFGTSDTSSGASDLFMWDSSHGMQDLGNLGGTNIQPMVINDSGQVEGLAGTADGTQHFFVWDSSHGMQELGTLGGSGVTNISPIFMTNSGLVSGDANFAGSSNPHAFFSAIPTANSPGFSAPSWTSIFGRATTLSGHLSDGSLAPPAGETVSVMVDGVTQKAVLDGSGNFSTTFSAGSLPAGSFAVSYIYFGDSNLGAAVGSSTLTVLSQPPPLSITADNQTIAYGAALPTLTASYSGFVNGDTAASLTTPPSLSTNATTTSPGGSYSITVSGASDPNYAISYVSGTLTIQDSTSMTVTSSLSSLSAGQPVTFTATVIDTAPGAGTPTGWVDFVDTASNTDLGMAPLSGGSASLTVSSLIEDSSLPGNIPHSIVATYEGDNYDLTSNSSATPLTIVVTDAPPTVAITNQLPADTSNNPTAPVGTLLSFGGSFNDSPAENRSLTSSDIVSWSVTLNGQSYSLPASVTTNGPTFNFTPTTVGTYVVSLTVADPDGGTALTQQTVDITSMDANSLQNVINAEANFANQGSSFFGQPPSPVVLTIQADPTQTNAAVAALNSVIQPQVLDSYNGGTIPAAVNVTLNLTSGNYSDLNFSLQPPAVDNEGVGVVAYVTVIVNGLNGSTTVVGNSPALTVTSGNVVVNNVTLTTATDAPTILVAGGSLALRSDVVQESTGFADAAIAVTSGTVDLGSTTDPGNNIINVNGAGQIVQNTTSTPISTAGNTFESGGVVLPGSNFTDTTVSGGMALVIPGQAVTLTATVASDSGSGTPTGSVTFVDTTSKVTLGTAPLVAGVATLTTPLSGAVGTHVIQANYTGDNTFLPSTATTSQSLTQSIFVLNGTASAALSVSGNAGINIPGTLVVDSSSKTALTESGNAKITAAGIQVVGGVSKSGNATLSPAATTGVSVVANPLANLTGPSTSGLASYGAVSYSKGSSTLNPGIYKSISASGNASLTLNPGLYLIEGGGLAVSGNASISGTGVTIYNTSSNYPNNTGSYGGITLSGNGTFTLTAPTSGPYAGIVIFQPPANTRAISLSGNAADGLGGTIYAPSALLYVSGNASVNGALVVNELSLSGNAASTQTAAGSDADNAGSTAGQLLAGNVEVYVDNSSGDLTPDELARIQDAVNAVDAVTTPYGVTVAEVSDPTQANVTLSMGTSSAAGDFVQGVLGCYTTTGQITLIQGWNWYAGSDPTQIGAAQYDFETTVTHELGHALGLGESSNPTSAMYGTLTPGTTIRTLTTADLNIPYDEGSADAQRAAVPQVTMIAGAVASNSAASGPSTTAANSTSSSSSSPMSGGDAIFADLGRLLSALSTAYQSELSSMSALWQTANALALQSLDALLSMEAGAMGMSKDTRMSDVFFAGLSAANGV